MTETAELKPCPFCGKPPKTRVRSYDGIIDLMVCCFNCEVGKRIRVSLSDNDFNKIRDEMDRVVALWNHRAGEEEQQNA